MTDEVAAESAAVVTEAAAAEVVDTKATEVAASAAASDAGTLAASGEPAEVAAPKASAFPEDWRKHIAGENLELLKTLERIKDPALLGKKLSELNKLASAKGAGPKKPGEGATPEEIELYRKEAGLPEKPELYVENVNLPDGRVLGEDDKAIAASFAAKVMGTDYTQAQFDSAIAWYTDHMEESQANLADEDRSFKAASLGELKTEWGPDYTRNVQVIGTLFNDAPAELSDRVLKEARDASGRLLGNDPAFVKWASGLAREINPTASIIPPGTDSGKGLDTELAELQTLMAKSDSEYWEGPKAAANQKRYYDLISARDKPSKR